MIWFALIASLVIGLLTGFYTRSWKKGLIAWMAVFLIGVLLSLVIVYSGLLGG